MVLLSLHSIHLRPNKKGLLSQAYILVEQPVRGIQVHSAKTHSLCRVVIRQSSSTQNAGQATLGDPHPIEKPSIPAPDFAHPEKEDRGLLQECGPPQVGQALRR